MVIKRNGKRVTFDPRKIKQCILMAFSAVRGNVPDVSPIVNSVCTKLAAKTINEFHVEEIQDTIETVLMDSGYHDVAKAFILYREERRKIRERRLSPNPELLQNYIFHSKYAKRNETWNDAVNRVATMHIKKFPDLADDITRAFDFVREKKVLPSMRSMQFGGAAIEFNDTRMYNCSFTHVKRWSVFSEIFYCLLSGCGVGYSVQWHHVEQLKAIKIPNRSLVVHYVVQDTIEGWADALRKLIHSFVCGYWVEFSYYLIRSEGSDLEVSGGKAPGHLPLKICLEKIRAKLLSIGARQLRPIECNDIICYVAEAVLSGGIRRSSLIALFDDDEMLYAKARGNFDPTNLNSERSLVNISRILSDCHIEDFKRILRIASEGYGEPGFFFTKDKELGCNPCGEIILDPGDGFAFCNLTEIDARYINEKVVEAATIIGTLQATYTDFKYLGRQFTVERDRLLGVSITGIMDNTDVIKKLAKYRKIVIRINEEWANKLCINPAARVCCVKPSGTASLLLGTSNGIHPHHSSRYFRRVTANPNETCAQRFKKFNPHAVAIKPNGDWCLTFCIEAQGKTLKDFKAVEFLAFVLEVKKHWADHNISCTISLHPEEMRDIVKMIWENRDTIGALSFAPMDLGTRYPYLPQEEANDEGWNYLIENYRDVDYVGTERVIDSACEGEKCITSR